MSSNENDHDDSIDKNTSSEEYETGAATSEAECFDDASSPTVEEISHQPEVPPAAISVNTEVNLTDSSGHIEWMLFLVASVHILFCPYTKVEESFNMQATHDLLYHGWDLAEYDHLEFPGVVPRTFAGPLVLAGASGPAAALLALTGCSRRWTQTVVRLALAALSTLAFGQLVRAVQRVFGRPVAVWLVCISCTQFHWPFYLGRTLPNMLAVPPTLLAVASWIRGRHAAFLLASGVAVLLFRAELVGLLAPMLLVELVSGRLSLLRCLKLGLPTAAGLIALSVAVDSLFWQRGWLWPEAEVLWFNVVLNRSVEWGTAPPLWYFYSALPRALAFSLPLVALGATLDRRCLRLVLPALFYVSAYSLLPHKELRFVLYTVPLLNVAAARACHAIWSGRTKPGAWRAALATTMCCHLALNAALTCLLAVVSSHNYPGGVALHRLQQSEPPGPANVHIDVFAAQTGVTRFLQWRNDGWSFNKSERLEPDSPEMRSFTHLLVGGVTRRQLAALPYSSAYRLVDTVEAFQRVELDYRRVPPLQIGLQPAVYVLRNRRAEEIAAQMHAQLPPDVLR